MDQQSKAEAASVKLMEDAIRREITGDGAHHAEIMFIDGLVDERGVVASIKVPGFRQTIYATVCPWGERAEIHLPREARDGLVVL